MEHVRLNFLTADPGLFDKLTTHLKHEVGPRLESRARDQRRHSNFPPLLLNASRSTQKMD